MASRLDQIRNERLKKIEKLKKIGINPYPSFCCKKTDIKAARKKMNKTVEVVGRIFSLRGHGKLVFADLRDENGQIQLMLKADELMNDFKIVELLDIGDFVLAKGKVTKTQKGEVSVLANELKLLSKSIRPLPEKREGLKDVEERYRKRYLDTLVNSNSKKLLDTRWLIEKEIRLFFWDKGYHEVETPVLQNLYGGTNARPFTTHMNALNLDLYLRIAPELYLKRLVVGGYEKIFEIARNFRNEGIDADHQPEFTMIEWYEAYADYHQMMDTTEALFQHLAKRIYGKEVVIVKGKKIDISGKWPRKTMVEVIKQELYLDVTNADDNQLKTWLKENQLKMVGKYSKGKAIFSIFEHLVTDKLINPVWVIDYPIDVCPLQKRHADKPDYAQRFEGYIGGMEICDGWTEIQDALEQRSRFETEQQHLHEGDEEAHPLDEEFIEALEYGLPPLGGIGIGIDRLVMFLTDTWTIRDVIAFPTLRPER